MDEEKVESAFDRDNCTCRGQRCDHPSNVEIQTEPDESWPNDYESTGSILIGRLAIEGPCEKYTAIALRIFLSRWSAVIRCLRA